MHRESKRLGVGACIGLMSGGVWGALDLHEGALGTKPGMGDIIFFVFVY